MTDCTAYSLPYKQECSHYHTHPVEKLQQTKECPHHHGHRYYSAKLPSLETNCWTVFVPLRKAGPLPFDVRITNWCGIFIGREEVLSVHVSFSCLPTDRNHHASLLCSPDWEPSPGNLQEERLLSCEQGFTKNATADICSLFHQIFNTAQLWKSNKAALVIACGRRS